MPYVQIAASRINASKSDIVPTIASSRIVKNDFHSFHYYKGPFRNTNPGKIITTRLNVDLEPGEVELNSLGSA